MDFHRLQVVFGCSAVHVTPPPPTFPEESQQDFFVSMRATATHRQLPVIVIWNIPNCLPIAANPRVLAGPLRAAAEGEQSAEQTKSFECGVDSKTKRVAFFSPNMSTDFKACARQVDGKRSDRALFSRKTHSPPTLKFLFRHRSISCWD